jgi:hypothetical protein
MTEEEEQALYAKFILEQITADNDKPVEAPPMTAEEEFGSVNPAPASVAYTEAEALGKTAELENAENNGTGGAPTTQKEEERQYETGEDTAVDTGEEVIKEENEMEEKGYTDFDDTFGEIVRRE